MKKKYQNILLSQTIGMRIGIHNNIEHAVYKSVRITFPCKISLFKSCDLYNLPPHPTK